VLLNLLAHNALLASGFVDFEEEAGLLIAMMLLYQSVPSEGVNNKVREVRFFQPRGLLVYAVETSDKRIVTDAHVRCFHGEAISL
jgi:hypothetical protein